MKAKEISLSELLSTDFIIVDDKMVGTFPLDRINMISDVLKQQKEEIDNLQDRIDKAIEYIQMCKDSDFVYIDDMCNRTMNILQRSD